MVLLSCEMQKMESLLKKNSDVVRARQQRQWIKSHRNYNKKLHHHIRGFRPAVVDAAAVLQRDVIDELLPGHLECVGYLKKNVLKHLITLVGTASHLDHERSKVSHTISLGRAPVVELDRGEVWLHFSPLQVCDHYEGTKPVFNSMSVTVTHVVRRGTAEPVVVQVVADVDVSGFESAKYVETLAQEMENSTW